MFLKLIAENTRTGVYEYGQEKLDHLLKQLNSEITESEDQIYYRLNGVQKRISRSKFTTLCGFGASLLFMLQKTIEKNVQVQNYKKIFFVIDNLPHEDSSLNIWKTLKLIIEKISNLYNISAKITGVGPIKDGIKGGKTVGPKEITEMILADWFTAIHYNVKASVEEKNTELKDACTRFVDGKSI